MRLFLDQWVYGLLLGHCFFSSYFYFYDIFRPTFNLTVITILWSWNFRTSPSHKGQICCRFGWLNVTPICVMFHKPCKSRHTFVILAQKIDSEGEIWDNASTWKLTASPLSECIYFSIQPDERAHLINSSRATIGCSRLPAGETGVANLRSWSRNRLSECLLQTRQKSPAETAWRQFTSTAFNPI